MEQLFFCIKIFSLPSFLEPAICKVFLHELTEFKGQGTA